jgi:hypothetical protein
MNVIQAQLGHSSLATTIRYLAHVHPQQVVEAMQGRPGWAPGYERAPGRVCSRVGGVQLCRTSHSALKLAALPADP